ncbi:sorbosone dehydrogenase [Ilyomonas limi]|uniref:Sorbosone dehydrogenase n=1 Tax=Ilyomonas limi TaxID=2575867 RepID=A0A4U3L339_9BACT|nr:PQQ-dependent sugar dehydrogenase [Ilyomonas limi]TKK67957.1 sorbosone dehydrogenase [Ilyomonas limi]
MRKITDYCRSGCAFLMSILLITSCNNAKQETTTSTLTDTTAAMLQLPPGFAATIVADSLGALRHLAVNKKGDIYVKLSVLKNGKGIYFLSDTNGDGKIDKSTGFGNYPGTGIRIIGNELYASSNTSVYKYELNDKGEVVDTGRAETIVQGLIDKGRDNAKAITLDANNHLYVAIGSYDETCTDAAGHGVLNCPLLDSVGGIWQFSTNKLAQSYADAVHYAKGLKNVVGLDWNKATNTLFATQHGRGGLHDKFPKLYTPEQDKALPAETLYELNRGDNAGWPYVYYDPFQHKKIVAPEYGGDGKKSVDDKYIDPVAVFPAHLGPNDLLFYTGSMFPEKYKNGAFIVFHSQSQPLKKGYLVAFVPFKDGKPAGEWEIFADNFTGVDLSNPNGSYQHRPIGIAQGPDGALYVADDLKGTIFKITYSGDKK